MGVNPLSHQWCSTRYCGKVTNRRKPSDNVPLANNAEVATVREQQPLLVSRAEGGLERGSMVNTRELLINIVSFSKPKTLIGLSQKARSGYKGLSVLCHGQSALPVDREDLTYHIITRTEHGKPVSSLRKGKPTARKADGDAGKGRRKKQRPLDNRADRDCGKLQDHPTRKRADFRPVFRHKRTWQTTLGRKSR
jgi:hypothetical protein